jgi:hypothetical protein
MLLTIPHAPFGSAGFQYATRSGRSELLRIVEMLGYLALLLCLTHLYGPHAGSGRTTAARFFDGNQGSAMPKTVPSRRWAAGPFATYRTEDEQFNNFALKSIA